MYSPVICLLFCIPAVGAQPLAQWKPQREGTAKELRLQDFCIFRHAGQTYIASMMKDFSDEGMIVARSRDLVSWDVLGKAVTRRTPEDKAMVWAPHVVEDRGAFHMFYTGVTVPKPGAWNQKILVASTRNPATPATWQRNNSVRFMVDGRQQSWFRPDHAGSVWDPNNWADCRDPMVLKDGQTWYMFYSGTDTTGGIVGVATAAAVAGPWADRGAVLRTAPGSVPESPFVLKMPDGTFLMTFNYASPDEVLKGSKTATGSSLLPGDDGQPPFSNIRSQPPEITGWAHEWLPHEGSPGRPLNAYLTGYFVNFNVAAPVRQDGQWTARHVATSQPATRSAP